jgi:XapX domain-containing protein
MDGSPDVKTYLISLAAGLLIGIIYSLLNVRSPAPPVIALVGLLGILVGEQAVPVAKRLLGSTPASAAELQAECAEHVLGSLPGRGIGGTTNPGDPK